MSSHQQKRQFLLPLALLFSLISASFCFFFLQMTQQIDERVSRQTQALVNSALTIERKSLADHALHSSLLGAISAELYFQPKMKSADFNTGNRIYKEFGVSETLLFDPEFRLIFSALNTLTPEPEIFREKLLTQIKTLRSQIKAPVDFSIETVTEVLRIDKNIYLAAASVIPPEKRSSSNVTDGNLLLLLKAVDQKMLDQLSKSYLLPTLNLTFSDLSATEGTLQLTSKAEESLGFLQWQPDQAGQKIYQTLTTAGLITLLVAMILMFVFFRRTQRFFEERTLLLQQLKEEQDRQIEKEEPLRAIIEAIPTPIFYKDLDGRYLGCNQAYSSCVGQKTHDIIGKLPHEISRNTWNIKEHETDIDLILQQSTSTIENRVLYADGTLRDVLCSKATIKTQDGKVLGLVGIMTDISDVKSEQREDGLLRNRLGNIIDAMPSMLITVDENQRVTEWNRWAAVASRVPAKKALGQPLAEVFPALTAHDIEITQVLESGKMKTWSRIPWKFNGKEIFIDLTVYPLVSGKPAGAVLRADNITDRVQMEKVLVLSEKMLSIGSLAAGMAHEINNPLAIMLQHTQILQNRLNPNLAKNRDVARDCALNLDDMSNYLEQRGIMGMLDAIRHAGDRAKTIVDEMVHFARQHKTEFKPCNLSELLDATLHLAESDYDLKKKYGFRNIEIRKEIPEHLPEITCDRNEIQQVILNLLRNSAIALHKANTEKPVIQVRLTNNEQGLQIELADNGPGIPPSLLTRIFEPFFTTAEAGEGSGLGLSVAYFIICEKHGGHMRAENSPRGGCRFIIKLPYKIPHIAAHEIAS